MGTTIGAATTTLPNTGQATTEYVVKPGDTLAKIASRLGMSGWEGLYELNKELIGPDAGRIEVGQKLRVVAGAAGVGGDAAPAAAAAPAGSEQPAAARTVTVAKGDSLSKIAARAGISDWHAIYERNKDVIGPDPDSIEIGMVLQLPEPDSAPATTDGGGDDHRADSGSGARSSRPDRAPTGRGSSTGGASDEPSPSRSSPEPAPAAPASTYVTARTSSTRPDGYQYYDNSQSSAKAAEAETARQRATYDASHRPNPSRPDGAQQGPANNTYSGQPAAPRPAGQTPAYSGGGGTSSTDPKRGGGNGYAAV